MTDILRVVSVSGGKDSTALYCWAIEQWGKDGFFAVFADTGNEHPVTINYVLNMPDMAGGPVVKTVRADFTDRIKTKFTGPLDDRSEGAQSFIKRNSQWAVDNNYSSGNPFLDMIMWKGRVPSSKAQFCTEHAKLEPIRDFIESIRGDAEVLNYVGIRAGESARRALMPERDWNKFMDCETVRPLLTWSEQKVFAYLKEKGVPPNPLYVAGFPRVGCFPCIHARKVELARLPDWAWDKLSEWEKTSGRSWFPPNSMPGLAPHEWPSIEQMREWSTTTRGGRQQDMFAPDAADVPSCMSTWGACE